MSWWGTIDSSSGPLLAAGAMGVLVLLLRWTFGRGRSLVERRPRSGGPGDYGMLVRVAAPATVVEAELLRLRLRDAGLRATLAPTTEGPAVLVFPTDAPAALAILHPPDDRA